MARLTPSFAERMLWPEFQQLHGVLRDHLDAVTRRVIATAIHGDATDEQERAGNA